MSAPKILPSKPPPPPRRATGEENPGSTQPAAFISSEVPPTQVGIPPMQPVTTPPLPMIPPPPTKLAKPLTAISHDQGPAVIPVQILDNPLPPAQQLNEAVVDLGGVVDIEGLHRKGQSEEEGGSDSDSSSSSAPSVEHFNISFEYHKTFREHKGANASPYCGRMLENIYSCVLQCTYNSILTVLGTILAVIWGLLLGCTAFLQTWIISPTSRVFLVIIKGCMPMVLEPVAICMKIYMKMRSFGV